MAAVPDTADRRTAAIVGVRMNLAVFFVWHMFWLHGDAAVPFTGTFKIYPFALFVLVFIALWKYGLDTCHLTCIPEGFHIKINSYPVIDMDVFELT